MNSSSNIGMSRMFVGFCLIVGLALSLSAQAQSTAPAPSPTSDGTSIDQGIAYMLMLVALLLTYLIHPLDASSAFNFF